MSPIQGPPDSTEQALWMKVGPWIMALLTAVVWRVWDFLRGEIKDLRRAIEGRVANDANKLQQDSVAASLSRIEKRLDKQDEAIESRVSTTEHERVLRDMGKLSEQVEGVRSEVSNQYREFMDQQAVGRQELRQTLDNQTERIEAAIQQVADRRVKPRNKN